MVIVMAWRVSFYVFFVFVFGGCAAPPPERSVPPPPPTVRELAEAGDPEAQIGLGLMLEWGHGVERDHAQAASWYRRAAEGGRPLGAFYLGQLYERGLGVEQDHAAAAEWYRKAATEGNASAQFKLGHFHEKGLGVEKNYAAAVAWYDRAAANWIAERVYPPGTERLLGSPEPPLRLAPPGPPPTALLPPPEVTEPGNETGEATPPPKSTTRPPERPEEDAPRAPSAGAGEWVHLASYRQRNGAIAAWHELIGRYPELLGSHAMDVRRVDLGPELGVFFRLRAGPLSAAAAAKALCRSLRDQDLYCARVPRRNQAGGGTEPTPRQIIAPPINLFLSIPE